MSEEDTEYELGLQALENRLDNDWDLCLPSPRVFRPIPPLEDQLENKLENNTDNNIPVKVFPGTSITDAVETELLKELRDDKVPKIKIVKCYPGRDTFVPAFSGLFFTEETTLKNEKLFVVPHPSRFYGKFLDLTAKELGNGRLICLETFFMGYCKLVPEEKHCIGKYVMLIMSIQQDQSTINLCSELLSYFGASWAPTMEDFLLVFSNWGIREELLHPPFKPDDSTTANIIQESRITLQDSNIFKVLDYLVHIYRKKPFEGWERSTILLRAVLLMWLDKRFILSWDRAKFSTYVSCIVDTISKDEWTDENLKAMGRIIDLPEEHAHNQSWIIENFLSHRSPRMQQFGRFLATSFFQHVLGLGEIPESELDLNGLQDMLIKGHNIFKQLDLYTISIFLSVLEHFIMTFMKKDMSESVKVSVQALEKLISKILVFSNSQCFDSLFVQNQLDGIKIKLKVFLEKNDFILADAVRLNQLASSIAKK